MGNSYAMNTVLYVRYKHVNIRVQNILYNFYSHFIANIL